MRLFTRESKLFRQGAGRLRLLVATSGAGGHPPLDGWTKRATQLERRVIDLVCVGLPGRNLYWTLAKHD